MELDIDENIIKVTHIAKPSMIDISDVPSFDNVVERLHL